VARLCYHLGDRPAVSDKVYLFDSGDIDIRVVSIFVAQLIRSRVVERLNAVSGRLR
jgi:hypothetical protein